MHAWIPTPPSRPPQEQTPLQSRHLQEQTLPQGRHSPTSWEQTHPPGADTPPALIMVVDTVKARVVHILLEYNLVTSNDQLKSNFCGLLAASIAAEAF